MRRTLLFLLISATLMLATHSCDDAACTLYNSTNCVITFYGSTGSQVAITDYLTIRAVGTDSILFNQGRNFRKLDLQLSYDKDVDTLLFDHWAPVESTSTEEDSESEEDNDTDSSESEEDTDTDSDETSDSDTDNEEETEDVHHIDTLYIRKTNIPHFESPDCGTAMFHDIQEIWFGNDKRYPDEPFFKSIYIKFPQVYYNSQDNVRITINE